jgi:hypothetical protein
MAPLFLLKSSEHSMPENPSPKRRGFFIFGVSKLYPLLLTPSMKLAVNITNGNSGPQDLAAGY